jgi:hypothetical protein
MSEAAFDYTSKIDPRMWLTHALVITVVVIH